MKEKSKVNIFSERFKFLRLLSSAVPVSRRQVAKALDEKLSKLPSNQRSSFLVGALGSPFLCRWEQQILPFTGLEDLNGFNTQGMCYYLCSFFSNHKGFLRISLDHWYMQIALVILVPVYCNAKWLRCITYFFVGWHLRFPGTVGYRRRMPLWQPRKKSVCIWSGAPLRCWDC